MSEDSKGEQGKKPKPNPKKIRREITTKETPLGK